MIWTPEPCWPTATSAGCCLSSSTPGRGEPMQKASQTLETGKKKNPGQMRYILIYIYVYIYKAMEHIWVLMLVQMYIYSTYFCLSWHFRIFSRPCFGPWHQIWNMFQNTKERPAYIETVLNEGIKKKNSLCPLILSSINIFKKLQHLFLTSYNSIM